MMISEDLVFKNTIYIGNFNSIYTFLRTAPTSSWYLWLPWHQWIQCPNTNNLVFNVICFYYSNPITFPVFKPLLSIILLCTDTNFLEIIDSNRTLLAGIGYRTLVPYIFVSRFFCRTWTSLFWASEAPMLHHRRRLLPWYIHSLRCLHDAHCRYWLSTDWRSHIIDVKVRVPEIA